MKKIIISLLLLSNLTLFSQSTYFLDKDDTKVIMYEKTPESNSFFNGDYAFGGYYLHYHNSKGKLKVISQSKIKELIDGDKRFINMKIGNILGSKRLQEVIFQNDKYLLTQYFEGGFHYAYVTDKTSGEFLEKKVKISWNHKKDQKKFKKHILPYFKECSEFVNLVKENTNEHYKYTTAYNDYNRMFRGISNMKCE